MTEPSPRKRFQFHLSTALVMMFVAGGLIWAQLPIRRDDLSGEFFTTTLPERQPAIHQSEFMKREDRFMMISCLYKDYGWPLTVRSIHEVVQLDRDGQIRKILMRGKYWMGGNCFSGDVVLVDALVCTLVLVYSFRLCEWLIHRSVYHNQSASNPGS